jgi:hypothetical protein
MIRGIIGEKGGGPMCPNVASRPVAEMDAFANYRMIPKAW